MTLLCNGISIQGPAPQDVKLTQDISTEYVEYQYYSTYRIAISDISQWIDTSSQQICVIVIGSINIRVNWFIIRNSFSELCL